MNVFRGITYVNIAGSLKQAFLILFFLFCPLLQVIGVPIVIGYLIRTIPEIIDGAPDMPSFSLMDFAYGLLTLLMGILYFLPAFVLLGGLSDTLTPKGNVTASGRDLLFILQSCGLAIVLLVFFVGVIRFALTSDPRAYLHLRSNIGLILTHHMATLSFVVNALIASCLAILFLVCGGFLFIPIWGFVVSYLLARYASDLGLASMKMKRKNDLLYAPHAEPEKQKAG